MRLIDIPSKITGFSLTDLEIKVGGAGSMTMKSSIVLQDKSGAIHARSEYIGPWSPATLECINSLLKTIEDDLTSIHFGLTEEENGRATRSSESESRESRTPIGIIGPRVGSEGGKASQF